MTKHHPVAWLAGQAKDLPTTMSRVLDRAVTEPARQAMVADSDAVPSGDGVEARLREADAAIERAQQLETEAAEKAVRAREASEQVDVARDTGEEDVRRAREEADQRAEQVVAEAEMAVVEDQRRQRDTPMRGWRPA